ncbi:hypothetical protein Cob_v012203 [Colletotrichum orbiculare MAFF 240422]|uniref:Uncharacterized protein n=1 Tax=Colletotrichum orbiculare (strain 104-T / ATCC 96160 / CBS 514.97 / LARS 414 / MAFF 240422) TaxID=1213857 RepID=A0A484F9C6_COLOR|nr:hypothetical protein Cob_v012203 [Colletotrichum orbiculare MAFF 240422]
MVRCDRPLAVAAAADIVFSLSLFLLFNLTLCDGVIMGRSGAGAVVLLSYCSFVSASVEAVEEVYVVSLRTGLLVKISN